MKYTRKKIKLEDFFEGRELKVIKNELQEVNEEEKIKEKIYTLEEVIECINMPQEEKEKMIQNINKQEEKLKRKYIKKYKNVINNYYLRKIYRDSKQYIS